MARVGDIGAAVLRVPVPKISSAQGGRSYPVSAVV